MSRSIERFGERLLVEASSAIVVLRDDRIATYGTPSAAELLGCEPLGRDISTVVAPESAEPLVAYLARLAQSSPGTTAFCEVELASDGRLRNLEVMGINRLDDPTLRGVVLTLVDVTRHVRRADELEKRATTDALTGLASRLVAHDRLGELTRSGGAGSFAIVDLDRLKWINDTYGPQAGDQVLATTGRGIAETLAGGTATAARHGGEEFALLFPGTSTGDALVLCERVLARISEPQSVGGAKLRVTATAGLTAIGRSVSQTISEANTALFERKRQGRGHVAVYDADRRRAVADEPTAR